MTLGEGSDPLPQWKIGTFDPFLGVILGPIWGPVLEPFWPDLTSINGGPGQGVSQI